MELNLKLMSTWGKENDTLKLDIDPKKISLGREDLRKILDKE